MLKTNWEAAEESAREAQDQMLSDAENWASSLKAVLENKLAKLGQTLENALTGGYDSFNAMTTALERANSLQEGYLTTTNKIYETNKLMRQAQQEIDKSTNSTAKKRLAAFIEETQELQNQSELSEYELQIQQAKYDLLLAEMALEEAQDAKSTVRLQRDSEGNFGYVYTADSSKVTEAQQQLEDAQNKLYNIGLDGANEYAEKYQQTMAEMYDTFADIQQQKLSGAFETEEEYHRAMEAAKDYYYQLLQKYSNQYSIALTTDSRIVADAWSTDFSSMIYDTERWMSEVDNYVDGTTKAFQDWQAAVTGENGVTSIIGNNVGEVASKVKNVADESKTLADITVKQVIPALDSEITSVDNLTGSYARMRDTIMQVIEQYGLLIKGINDETKQDWNNDNTYSNIPSGNGNTTGTENTVNSNGVIPENNNLNGNNNINSLFDNTTTTAEPYLAVGSQVTVKSTATHFSRDGGSGTKMKDFVKGSTYSVMDFDDDEVCIGRGSVVTGWVNKDDLIGFDTGGYTGSWDGAYGKLALLHQKEMVLNAYDTENLLASMEVLNRILEVIDLQSMNAQMGGLLSSPSWHGNNESVIEQQITIEANFPAAQDRNEIEEAFNNLLNKASQYANRK